MGGRSSALVATAPSKFGRLPGNARDETKLNKFLPVVRVSCPRKRRVTGCPSVAANWMLTPRHTAVVPGDVAPEWLEPHLSTSDRDRALLPAFANAPVPFEKGDTVSGHQNCPPSPATTRVANGQHQAVTYRCKTPPIASPIALPPIANRWLAYRPVPDSVRPA